MATQDDSKWKVKREISLGDLVAIAVAMGGVILAYGTLDRYRIRGQRGHR